MSLIVDTNILLRAMIFDHEVESSKAQALLASNEVTISNQTLCEMVWVLRRLYKKSQSDLAVAIRTWMSVKTVAVDRGAVEAGLTFLEAGGDFADGVIEFEGRRLGGEIFATFDKRAASIVRAQGRKCLLLAAD
ncbi:type II toxin-antitoxin system VapC family toxin [Neorhizobium sp. T25_27]|uniref:type II toxin-antitoxin system VapC family toxin n=1 Tax=Neorhizobium sp. T25_27 TaxID=2093831 RepID=UPI001FDF5502|nr:type II toxin-antitoxin system VapC family toxin [Neorhizobium sp. T25_27]